MSTYVQKNILSNLKKLKKYNEIIIEKYIGGREIQVAILGKKIGSYRTQTKKKILRLHCKI